MRASRVERGGRGWVRGLFLFTVVVVCACEKSPPPAPKPPLPDAKADAGKPAATDTGKSEDVAPEPPPAPAEFTPPWSTQATPWAQLSKEIADTPIGKISGEAWGLDMPLHGFVRAQCGSGALLQAIFKSDKGLMVTPAMPVRFFGLPTSEEGVSYTEGAFKVKAHFTEDSASRVAGNFIIKYDEHGQEKTFIDLTVDGKPLTMLYPPKLDGGGRLPEFHLCHPSGRFFAEATDGRVAQGYVYGGLAADGKTMLLTPLLSPQTGLRIVVYSEEAIGEPRTVDLSKDNDGPVRVMIEGIYTPELTTAAEATGQNLGSEQTVTVRSGLVTLVWKRAGKSSELSLHASDVRIPELIEGPLRGTTLKEFRIEAKGVPAGVYPDPPPAEPLTSAGKD